MKHSTIAASVLSLALFLTGSAYSQSIYKCRNAAGKIEISDNLCRADSKTEAIRDGSAISESRRQEAAQVSAANRLRSVRSGGQRLPHPIRRISSSQRACRRSARGRDNNSCRRNPSSFPPCSPDSPGRRIGSHRRQGGRPAQHLPHATMSLRFRLMPQPPQLAPSAHSRRFANAR